VLLHPSVVLQKQLICPHAKDSKNIKDSVTMFHAYTQYTASMVRVRAPTSDTFNQRGRGMRNPHCGHALTTSSKPDYSTTTSKPGSFEMVKSADRLVCFAAARCHKRSRRQRTAGRQEMKKTAGRDTRRRPQRFDTGGGYNHMHAT